MQPVRVFYGKQNTTHELKIAFSKYWANDVKPSQRGGFGLILDARLNYNNNKRLAKIIDTNNSSWTTRLVAPSWTRDTYSSRKHQANAADGDSLGPFKHEIEIHEKSNTDIKRHKALNIKAQFCAATKIVTNLTIST